MLDEYEIDKRIIFNELICAFQSSEFSLGLGRSMKSEHSDAISSALERVFDVEFVRVVYGLGVSTVYGGLVPIH